MCLPFRWIDLGWHQRCGWDPKCQDICCSLAWPWKCLRGVSKIWKETEYAGCTLSIFLRWSKKFSSAWSSRAYGINVLNEGGKALESIGKPGSTSIGEHHPRGAGEAIEVLHLGIAEARSTGLRIISFSCCRHATSKPYQNQMWFDPQPMPTPYGLKIYPLLANPRYIQRLLHVENVSSVRELSMGVFFFIQGDKVNPANHLKYF